MPNPMGSNKFTTWGVAVANPLATPFLVTEVKFHMDNNEQFFKTVTAIRPATGWTLPDKNTVRWTGSLTIDPHDAENFMVSIQGNGKNGVDKQLTVTVNNPAVLSKIAFTTENQGNPPAANLYYLAAGQPSVYTYGGSSGQRKNFTAVVKETQNVNINAGAVLRVVIPAGWSAVQAPTTQTGFTTRTIVQPTATVDGEVRTTTSANFKNGQRTFTFSAVAPAGVFDSLYKFPTTLTSAQVRSSCDMLAKVEDDTGGLSVEHLSPPILETNINQIDLEVVSSASVDTPFTLSIYNFTLGTWEALQTATVTAAAPAVTMLAPVTSNFGDYFDAPLSSTSKHMRIRMKATAIDNYRLDEDYVAFIVSQYRVTPTDRAPANTFRNAMNVPMLALNFSTDTGSVDLYTVKVTAGGSDPVNDVTAVHLVEDLDCDGVIDVGETDLVPSQPVGAGGTVTFGVAPTPLLTFVAGTPACAIVAYDISAAAGAFDVVNASIASGFDLTSSVGPLYPFPAVGGYPIASSDSLIPGGPPELALDKTVAPPIVPPAVAYPVGTTVTYSIAVSNIGESASTNVVVSDALDPMWAPYTGVITPMDGGVLCVPPTCNPAKITWPAIATLAGNSTQVVTLHFSAVIPNSVPDGTSVPNTATAVSTEQPTAVSSNQAGLPVCAPVLELTKTLPATPTDYAVGEVIQWTISVHNTGSCPANNVVLTDTIDVVNLDEPTLVFNPVGSYNAATNTQTWTLAQLQPNATANYTVAGTILAAAQGATLCNRADANWNEAVAPLSSDPPACTRVPVVPPRCTQSLLVNKTLPLTPADYAEGEPIEWTITVQNNGSCAATGVTVKDTLDTSILEAPFTFTPATGVYDAPTSTYTWPAASVAGGGAQVLSFMVRGIIKAGSEGLSICDTAIVSYDQGTPVTSNPTTGTCSSVPIIPPRCSAAAIAPVTALVAVKTSVTDITFGWTGPAALEQHLNSVTSKRNIPNAKRAPVGVGVAVCTNPTAGCTVTGAITPPPTLAFYLAYGACSASGSDEGN